MKCLQCGGGMKSSRENYKYTASGLPRVTMLNVEVTRCPKCGEAEVSIPHLEQLHRLIANLLIQKKAPLTGAEVAFLRKFLGWSGVDFASHMGVAPETVSRWERDRDQMAATADRLLRLMVATREPEKTYELELLKGIEFVKPKDMQLGLKVTSKDWGLAAV